MLRHQINKYIYIYIYIYLCELGMVTMEKSLNNKGNIYMQETLDSESKEFLWKNQWK